MTFGDSPGHPKGMLYGLPVACEAPALGPVVPSRDPKPRRAWPGDPHRAHRAPEVTDFPAGTPQRMLRGHIIMLDDPRAPVLGPNSWGSSILMGGSPPSDGLVHEP